MHSSFRSRYGTGALSLLQTLHVALERLEKLGLSRRIGLRMLPLPSADGTRQRHASRAEQIVEAR